MTDTPRGARSAAARRLAAVAPALRGDRREAGMADGDPGRERAGRLGMRTVILWWAGISVVALLATLGTGALTPGRPPVATTLFTAQASGLPTGGSAPGRPAPAVVYQALAGYACPSTATSGFAVSGYRDDGTIAEWHTVPSGGATNYHCTGAFLAMPMSGSAGQDDPADHAQWWFDPPGSASQCTVDVYVPAAVNSTDVEGAPAYYLVSAGRQPAAAPLGHFEVDQTIRPGQWVDGGTFPAAGGRFAVELVNRGIDRTDAGADYHHLAVDAVYVSCNG